jgi:hypothetical protein
LRPAVTFQKKVLYQLRPEVQRVRVLVASCGHFSEKDSVSVASIGSEVQSTSCVPRSLFRYNSCLVLCTRVETCCLMIVIREFNSCVLTVINIDIFIIHNRMYRLNFNLKLCTRLSRV